MSQQLDRTALQGILISDSLDDLSGEDLVQVVRKEPGVAAYRPDGIYQVDPRNGDRILYNSARARRPHDNRPRSSPASIETPICVVCEGQTTGVIDVADLSTGYTFINQNLFPMLYPALATRSLAAEPSMTVEIPEGGEAYGFHFLQWTSSFHDKDWHNMPVEDRCIVLHRLARMEFFLLNNARDLLAHRDFDVDGNEKYVSIIKNEGRLVGGSLAHGHQQIAFSNVMPRRVLDNWHFQQRRATVFSDWIQKWNPANLCVKDYGAAVLLVPYFMRRPYDMMLLLKNTTKQYLYELDDGEIEAVADGWRDAIRFIRWIMPQVGRELAYNVISHNGPGAGVYFEFLPYTQETGGFEHLGLFVCQSNPQEVAARALRFLSDPISSAESGCEFG